MRNHTLALAAALLCAAPAIAQDAAKLPTRDIVGAKDNPVLKRYEGSLIISYDRKSFSDFRLPLSPLKPTTKTDASNNRVQLPDQQRDLEGAVTRLAYLAPIDRSPLEVLRNYEDEVRRAGGEVLFTCKTEACGGDQNRTSAGGGSDQSLMQYFFNASDVKDPAFSIGACALTSWETDQRYSSARFPVAGGDVHLAIHTYQVASPHVSCAALAGRTIAVVHVIEPRPREAKMVTVSAAEMSSSLNATGRIALYGILFDHDKTDIKPESQAAIAEIALLLRN